MRAVGPSDVIMCAPRDAFAETNPFFPSLLPSVCALLDSLGLSPTDLGVKAFPTMDSVMARLRTHPPATTTDAAAMLTYVCVCVFMTLCVCVCACVCSCAICVCVCAEVPVHCLVIASVERLLGRLSAICHTLSLPHFHFALGRLVHCYRNLTCFACSDRDFSFSLRRCLQVQGSGLTAAVYAKFASIPFVPLPTGGHACPTDVFVREEGAVPALPPTQPAAPAKKAKKTRAAAAAEYVNMRALMSCMRLYCLGLLFVSPVVRCLQLYLV